MAHLILLKDVQDGMARAGAARATGIVGVIAEFTVLLQQSAYTSLTNIRPCNSFAVEHEGLALEGGGEGVHWG